MTDSLIQNFDLSGLKPREWYKPVIMLSIAVILGVLFLPLQIDIPKIKILLISLGAFFIGIGEQANHHYPILIGSSYPSNVQRSETKIGKILDGIGVVLILVGLLLMLFGVDLILPGFIL
jgi:asparagine N-glycosylation enzyme membrane subunit Stt3